MNKHEPIYHATVHLHGAKRTLPLANCNCVLIKQEAKQAPETEARIKCCDRP